MRGHADAVRAARGCTAVGAGSFLGDLDADDARVLLEIGIRRSIAARTTVVHEGDEGTGVMVVCTGRLKASSWHADGREQLLSVHGPGDLVGVIAGIDGGVRTASLTTLERAELVFVARDRFLDLLATRPAIALAVMEQLCRDFRNTHRRELALGGLDTTGRVARQLADLASSFGEPTETGTRISIPVTHQDLAGWVGASREAVGKAMAMLERLGHISSPQRRMVVVRDPAALATFGA
jgi:CRP/FNR family transcriptional regulator, cyclic AMP receptor protein